MQPVGLTLFSVAATSAVTSGVRDTFQCCHGILGLRSQRIVSVDFRVADDAGSADDVSRREGQCPGVIPIGFRQVDPELQVECLQVFRQLVPNTKAAGSFVARITEDIK